ncbi:MAG: hypothetical protein ACTIB2_07050, partial [Brachybacterium tyrofermentans]
MSLRSPSPTRGAFSTLSQPHDAEIRRAGSQQGEALCRLVLYLLRDAQERVRRFVMPPSTGSST